MRWLPIYCLVLLTTITSCSKKFQQNPIGEFKEVHEKPDYSLDENWAALPDRKDQADKTVNKDFKDIQGNAKIDVFFVHPTIYAGNEKSHINWNGPVDDNALNKKTDESTILYQASIFNGTGDIYAPRYRQAHYHAYYTKDKKSAKQALDLAYRDVKAAFEYYMKHKNNGRPIIIASHSQGTTHSARLLKEFFDGKDLYNKLVAAYIVGIPTPKAYFKKLKPCEAPNEIGCYCTWTTYQKGHYPPNYKSWYEGRDIAITNPLTWTTDTTYASADKNLGGILWKFHSLKKGLVDAQIKDGMLWTSKPKFFGNFLYKEKNYHIGDYNLFYKNIRENSKLRRDTYLEKNIATK